MKYVLAWVTVVVLAISLTWFASEHEAPSVEAGILSAVAGLPIPGSFLANLATAITGTEPDLAIGVAMTVLVWRSIGTQSAIALVLMLLLLPVVQHELKALVDRPRPPFDPDTLWLNPSRGSFPSGHVMSTTGVYGYLLWFSVSDTWQRKNLRVACGLLAALALLMSALAGIYLSLHWPSDVLGGLAWGLTLLLPTVWVTFKGIRPEAPKA